MADQFLIMLDQMGRPFVKMTAQFFFFRNQRSLAFIAFTAFYNYILHSNSVCSPKSHLNFNLLLSLITN